MLKPGGERLKVNRGKIISFFQGGWGGGGGGAGVEKGTERFLRKRWGGGG